MGTELSQLREAAERARDFLGKLTPNSFSQPDSGLTYGQSASVYKELAAALATYAAEQLSGDRGVMKWVSLDDARAWPEKTPLVIRWIGGFGKYIYDMPEIFDADDWEDAAYQFLRLDTPTT